MGAMGAEQHQHPLFGPADYAMFAAMMGVSALVGVYYGCYKRQDTAQDYLLGGKAMTIFPIAMSLIARLVLYQRRGMGAFLEGGLR